jgi:nucleotide-binding universal stress UspA family protein
MDDHEKNNLVVVTYDFTEQADCALNHASYIAKQTGAEIALLHIINNESKSKYKAGSGANRNNFGAKIGANLFKEHNRYRNKNVFNFT